MPPGHMRPPRGTVSPTEEWSKRFLQSTTPRSVSIAYRLSDTPVTTTICFGPSRVDARPTTSAGSSECISRGTLSSAIFHTSLMSLALRVVRIASSCCQAVRRALPPSVSQSAGWLVLPLSEYFGTTFRNSIFLHPPPSTFTPNHPSHPL